MTENEIFEKTWRLYADSFDGAGGSLCRNFLKMICGTGLRGGAAENRSGS